MTTSTPVHGISAVEAFRLANITYRQLDYWARQGWVGPSIEAGTGRPGRRLYSPDDVIRLAALGHLGRSGLDVGRLGPQIAPLQLPDRGDYLIVLGPGPHLEVVTPARLRSSLSTPGSYTVFDPDNLRRRMARPSAAHAGDQTIESRIA